MLNYFLHCCCKYVKMVKLQPIFILIIHKQNFGSIGNIYCYCVLSLIRKSKFFRPFYLHMQDLIKYLLKDLG